MKKGGEKKEGGGKSRLQLKVSLLGSPEPFTLVDRKGICTAVLGRGSIFITLKL